MGVADFFIGPIKRLVIYQLKKDCKMTKILTMPAMATEGTTVCYTVTHDDLIDFAREIIERTKEMDEAEKAETSASVVDGYYTRKEELIEDLNSDVSQKKNRCRYLDLQISNRDAVLQQRQKQADGLPSLGFPPEKGPLGYNTKEEEQYFASAVAKDRLSVASAIKVDDEPTRKQMWDVIQEYRPKVKEYDKLISSPDALERKAKEIREQQSRQRIMEVILVALGPDFKPEYFESLPTYGGYDELVTGHFEYGGDCGALQICPSAKVFSTYSRDVRDISSANSLGDREIWTSHGNVVDLKLQLRIQEFINSQKMSRIRFTSFEKESTSSGVEYLFYGDDGRNYHRQSNGNVYSADASKIPTLSQCRERAKDSIRKVEIKMKEVTMP